ncbi:S-layer homology domain-containing protein [Mastigocoleus testarum]|uniref:SLH domain-containing protein n=1 Tax=Mastigocoleus testarum BC008 TaxID=371196 RepID=A0A0V7ZFS9_9CYAN|nr:S-layer homology domain-containing protein [Mastigocoleus testarum]KST63371.1 hypothetical protein BC008_39535 [Mastigocoleus testarum BC008]
MTNPPPNNSESSRTGTLGFDEFIAILVAFATIGGILFWSFSRKPDGSWKLNWFSNQFSNLSSQRKTSLQTNQPSIVIGSRNTEVVEKQSPVLSLLPQNNKNLISESTISPNRLQSPEIPGSRPSLSDRVKLGPILPENSDSSNLVTSPEDSELQVSSPAKTSQIPEAKDKDTNTNTNTNNGVRVTPDTAVTPSPVDKETAIVTPKTFTDVEQASWERPFIDALSSRGMIDGYQDNSFKPDQPVSRAEFAALLNQAFNKQKTPRKLEFKDIKPDFWANSAIEEAVSTKFLSGYGDQTFKPTRKIPRVEVLVAIVSGLNLEVPSSTKQVLETYEDANKIPKYAREKIAIATANNLVVDSTGTLKKFAPDRQATRAEVVAMIHQALVRTNKLQPIRSDKIVPYQP